MRHAKSARRPMAWVGHEFRSALKAALTQLFIGGVNSKPYQVLHRNCICCQPGRIRMNYWQVSTLAASTFETETSRSAESSWPRFRRASGWCRGVMSISCLDCHGELRYSSSSTAPKVTGALMRVE